MKDMIIGVDLAKRIFQVHGAARSGDVLLMSSGDALGWSLLRSILNVDPVN